MPPPGVCMNIVNARHQKDGSGTYENPEKFLKQDYQAMKAYLLNRRGRFVDGMFPPGRSSIGGGLLNPQYMDRIIWKRPHELASNPCFFVDGVSRFDFGQGVVGNCWFLASIGALTFQDFIFERVVPQDQQFDDEYCGLFHFRFWRFGRWVDVIIDDKLPTINGRPIFVHSKDPNEFWPALLEKAYAKVCGSYADMNAGNPSEALVDFTGGVHISIKLADPHPRLWELLCRAGESHSLMGCGTYPGETPENTVLPNGIVQGHAYTVTGVRQVMSRGQPVNLVRLWNPWGKTEWIGDWSDESPLWQTVSPEERKLCLEVGDNGEFWMTLQDFFKFYSDLDICTLCPDFLDGSSSCHWQTSYYEGRWVAGITAGGCIYNQGTFWTNPQYRVRVEALRGECSQTQGGDNMLVSLMQKPDKRNRRLVQNLHIGFSIFEVTDEYKGETGKFSEDFFTKNQPVVQTQNYVNAREVMLLLMLKPGEYLIVPSTFKPNETASFIVTILSKAETHVHENSDGHHHEPSEDHDHEEEPHSPTPNREDDENTLDLFRKHTDKFEEVNAEQLQKILNNVILKGDLKSGGFSIDACRSMIALMDTSITGKLNGDEFLRMWRKVSSYVNIFNCCDVSKTGTLSLNELRNAALIRGKKISDDMLNLMALRYGGSAGNITLESFISLGLRFDCMIQIFQQLSDGLSMTLREKEWLYLSMYT